MPTSEQLLPWQSLTKKAPCTFDDDSNECDLTL